MPSQVSLAIEDELQRVEKVGFGFFECFTLRDSGRDFFDEASVAATWIWFKDACQLHMFTVCGR